jgi:tetratricopeptide (TPR) repeat protein
MNEATSESHSLRAFVRGAWLLLLMQLAVAVLVFGFLAAASARLNAILAETAARRDELARLRVKQTDLQKTLDALHDDLQHARDATPFVRDAINAYHAGRYPEAIAQYQQALALDAGNWYVTDLLSYSQYMAGRESVRDGQPTDAARYFEDAITSVRHVIEAQPDYIGGYVELAIYECAGDRPESALAAYDAALARTTDARGTFASRAAEIPKRCSALHRRLAAR